MQSRITAASITVSKKFPIPGVQYSNRSYSASIELELMTEAEEQGIEAQIGQILTEKQQQLEGLIDSWFKEQDDKSNDAGEKESTHQNENPSSSPATPNRIRYIEKLARGIMTVEQIWEHFGKNSLEELTMSEASALIDGLKQRRNDQFAQQATAEGE